MELAKGFFCNRSNWVYFTAISFVFIAGIIVGINLPKINIIISLIPQPLADWIVAASTVGLLLLAFITKNQWLKQAELYNHLEFTQAFHQYYLLKVSAVKPMKEKIALFAQIAQIKEIRSSLKEKQSNEHRLDYLLEEKEEELKQYEIKYKDFYLEMDQGKEKMLIKACIINLNRKKINDFATRLATYQMESIINDFGTFRCEANEAYLEIQRAYFPETELVHFPPIKN
ncbi:hypothetical protein I6F65_14690 [Pseudoalteromonas sp. SWXJZ94C]|uniref:hypothetical protein n=1 Tax=Pseudoalteromonas sp. SWXJZ94C TaxID=2792065 RepID=UPI0018CF8D85|nr:hypothetical protein [Pseudoalteromonas sp. SWXJZ94C]MBH0058206.1 hypothetical protein [Pseudoalteromonas sp. SWXJZ94C]